MVIDNIGKATSNGVAYVEREEEMRAYDALPQPLRELVRDAPIKLYAGDVLADCRQYGAYRTMANVRESIRDIVAELQRKDAQELQQMRQRLLWSKQKRAA